MYKILMFFTLVILMSCGTGNSEEQKKKGEKPETSNSDGQKEMDHETEHSDSSLTLQLNNGSKWDADSTTRLNVASLMQLVNDKSYGDKAKRIVFQSQLQNRLDTLVKQCRMIGPAHEALHAWLKPVIHDSKVLKEREGDYDKKYAQLRKDVRSFYDYFD
jgi:hypothetical protein